MCNFCGNNIFTDAIPNPVNPNYGVNNSGYVWTDPVPCCAAGGGGQSEIFNFGSLPLGASSCTTPIEIERNGSARAEIELIGANGNAVVCFETSLDGVNYYPYNGCSVLEITENTMVILGDLDSKYYRFCVKSDNPKHTSTTGTVQISVLVNE